MKNFFVDKHIAQHSPNLIATWNPPFTELTATLVVDLLVARFTDTQVRTMCIAAGGPLITKIVLASFTFIYICKKGNTIMCMYAIIKPTGPTIMSQF